MAAWSCAPVLKPAKRPSVLARSRAAALGVGVVAGEVAVDFDSFHETEFFATVATALDGVAGVGAAAGGEGAGGGGFDDVEAQVGFVFFEAAGEAGHCAAAAADESDEGVEIAGGLLPDFFGGD